MHPKEFPTLKELTRTIPRGGLLSPSLRRGTGGIDYGRIRGDTLDCKVPGLKVRSGGRGRGLAKGRGFGPIGRPFRSYRR